MPIDAAACPTPACTSCATPWPAACSNTGGTLKEVADVLRHRELDTSLIYAKVDIGRLGGGGHAVAGERGMSAGTTVQAAVQRYLHERRQLGFALKSPATELMRFARFADARGHRGATDAGIAARVGATSTSAEPARSPRLAGSRSCDPSRPTTVSSRWTPRCRQRESSAAGTEG